MIWIFESPPFLKSGVALVAGAGAAAAQSPAEKPAPDDPTASPGRPSRAYGERSRFEKTARTPSRDRNFLRKPAAGFDRNDHAQFSSF